MITGHQSPLTLGVLQIQLRQGLQGLVHRRLEFGKRKMFVEYGRYGDRSGEGGQVDWADLRNSQDGGYAGTNDVPIFGG